jgi:hypothetical protein
MPGEDSSNKDFFYDSKKSRDSRSQNPSPRPHEIPAAPPAGLTRPRLKHATATGHSAPSGSSLAPPRPNPLPARGSGFILFLNIVSALIAVTFAVLLAIKL